MAHGVRCVYELPFLLTM